MEGVTLTSDELARYARQIILPEISGVGQKRLARASVAMVGAGGIGSPAIQYLAAAGIGRLVLIDDDRVELSNLQRQTIFRTADIGLSKGSAAARAAIAINPNVTVEIRETRLTRENAAELLADANVVVDGSDSFDTRLAVADAAFAARIPLISAAVGQFDAQLAVYRGWEADKPCYRCLVGNEPSREGGSCAEDGILGPVAGMIGSLAALEAIRSISSFGADPAGQLLIADLLYFKVRTVRLQKDPACRCRITTW